MENITAEMEKAIISRVAKRNGKKGGEATAKTHGHYHYVQVGSKGGRPKKKKTKPVL